MALANNISDIDLANLICNGDNEKLSFFQNKLKDDFFYHASKLAKRTEDNKKGFDYWIYFTVKKIPVYVTDEVAESYKWLVEYIREKCCNYNGSASLRTYVNNIMSSPWARSDWLEFYYKRFTSHGIVRKGSISYIPTCIKKLSATHQSVFKLLRRFKIEEEISTRLGLELYEVIDLVNEIKDELIKAGKMELITNISSFPIDELYVSDEKNKLMSEIYDKFKMGFDNLYKIEKELLKLKYYLDYSVSDIMDFYKESGRLSELNNFGLSTERHIYDRLQNLTNVITENLSDNQNKDKKEAVLILIKKLLDNKYE